MQSHVQTKNFRLIKTLKKAEKGTTTVIINREHKIYEGQFLLDDINNY